MYSVILFVNDVTIFSKELNELDEEGVIYFIRRDLISRLKCNIKRKLRIFIRTQLSTYTCISSPL